MHAIATIEDAVQLLLSDDKSNNKFTFTTLLSKLCTMAESNNSDRAAIIPHLGRLVTIMERYQRSPTLVMNGMTLIRFLCKHGDGQTAMSAVTTKIMMILRYRINDDTVR